jgi:hypothetical protein
MYWSVHVLSLQSASTIRQQTTTSMPTHQRTTAPEIVLQRAIKLPTTVEAMRRSFSLATLVAFTVQRAVCQSHAHLS